MKALKGGAALLVALILSSASPAVAQTAGKLFVRPYADAYFPLDTYTNDVTGETGKLYSTLGVTAGAALDYQMKNWLYPFIGVGFVNMPFAGGGTLTATEGMLGLGLVYRPMDRLSFRLDAMGGMASLSIEEQSGTGYTAGARLGIAYRLTPAFSIAANGGYSTLLGTQSQILSAIGAGLSFSYDLSALGGAKPKVAVEDPKLEAVFPSLYAYYDDNAFGTVKVTNREDAKISGVKVSFNASRYMDQPKVCAEYDELAKGASVEVPMKALFSDTVLQITQGIDAKGEVIVEYSYLGSDRVAKVPIDFRMHHRNAITWSDDRRAAAFVSPTNPAALWFSRFAAGTVRDRIRGDINKPLQYAIGMFEAERLYGLNYVVVPANDYSVKHGLKDYIDSVQFPHQTLQNRGGDCSDLAILFASLMQSVGVDAAFITIPGHIFAAFDTGLSEAEARASFYDPGLLVYKDGRAWVPVEITMVKDGFIKAWRVGAKEWYDSSRRGNAAFYRLPDCWKVYPPAAFPGVNPRFVLPSEADAAVAFDGALDRFVAREMGPMIEDLRAELASERPETRANEMGILYAHYGMLKDSWKELAESAKGGCQPAWTNLGNVAYLRKDYKLALSYYQWSYKQNPQDDDALLGVARCQYELEDFDSSDEAYAALSERNPALAGKFGYLGSIFGGEGRAWSLSERYASTNWASARKTTVAAAPKPVAKPAQALKPKKAPEPVAPPTISSELPTDSELAKATAESEAQKKAAMADALAAEKAKASPSEAPHISSELPADLEMAAKRAASPNAPAPAAKPKVSPPIAVPPPAPVDPTPEPQGVVATRASEPPAFVPAIAEQKPALEPEPAPERAPEPERAPKVEVAAAAPAPAPEPTPEPASAPEPVPGAFDKAKSILGSWIIEGDKATQTDKEAFFAKLAIPLDQDLRVHTYSFVAKSTAPKRGWVGVGAHLFTPVSRTLAGYGSGDSLVVWLTRDPVHFKKDITRFHVYRSVNDCWMKLIGEAVVTESIYDENRFDVKVDPKAGTLTVSLNGTERLKVKNLRKLHAGRYVILRALDTAEFSAFKVEAGE
jgi:tetratricopeptide (TPR) repeat protein